MNKYRLLIKGSNPEYFLKKIIRNHINIYEVSKSYKELNIVVDEDGYKVISNIKTSYEIIVKDVYGAIKMKEVFKRYFYFILFFLLGICLNIFLSNIIFEVEVVHSNSYIKELIYNELDRYGISKFSFVKSFKEKEIIINKILNNNKDDIEWLEIERIGTKYKVNVERRKLNIEEEICKSRDVVAKKQATIISIEAEEGEVVKKINDYVGAGDVVISGVIHNKEEIVSNKCARGKIFGEVWYKVVVELPINYRYENVTGKDKVLITINFLNKKVIINNKFDTYKVKDIYSFKSKLLPLSLDISNYLETDVVEKKYTLKNAENEAISMAEEKLKERLGEEDLILTKKVLKKELKRSKIIVEVFLKVKEDITAYREIQI